MMAPSWKTKKLGEICEVTTGSSNTVDAVKNGKYAFFDRSKVIKKSNRFLFDSDALIIPGEGAEFFPKYYSGKFDLHQRAYALLNFNNETDIKFVEYFLIFEHKHFERVAVGATAKSLRRRHFVDLEIPFPSIDEQKYIVKKLDDVFEKVKLAKRNAQRNLENSKELFNSYLSNSLRVVRTKSGETRLGDVCESVEYGTSAKSKKSGKVAVLRMGNIQNGRIDWGSLVYTDNKDEINKYLLKNNDVLFNRTNSPELVGKTAIYKGEMPAIFAGYLIRIHRNEKLLDADYLNYFLNSDYAKEQGKKVVISSVNQANINGQKLKDYLIPLPSLAEQKKIAKKLNVLSLEIEKLEGVYRQKLTHFEEFKKSILKMAFSGELSALVSPVQVSQQTSVAVPSPYIRNQVHAAIVDQVVRDNGSSTEVAVAKYDHLLQELYGLSLGYQFATHQFGPFDAQIKRLVSSGLGRNKWFTKRSGMIVFGSNVNALLSRQSNLYRSAQASMKELSRLGITKLDADGVELLSTICHSIKETGSVTFDAVREFMSQWQTDNNTRTKAEKFSEERTQKCLDFILNNNLQQKLLPTT